MPDNRQGVLKGEPLLQHKLAGVVEVLGHSIRTVKRWLLLESGTDRCGGGAQIAGQYTGLPCSTHRYTTGVVGPNLAHSVAWGLLQVR